MNTLDKLEWISEHSKPHNEILIRTNNSKMSGNPNGEWFVHYTYEWEDSESSHGVQDGTVYREFTDSLDAALDDIISIITDGLKEKYYKRTCD